MRFSRVWKYLRCSFFVASKKARSNFSGVLGMASGAWPRINVIFVRPDLAKVSWARGKRFLRFDSMV